MKLRITHDTRYLYEHMVDGALHQAHLRPVATPLQTTLLHALDVDPAPAWIEHRQDLFGNGVDWFAIDHPHDHLGVRSVSDVCTTAPPPAFSTVAWEAVRERFVYRQGAPYDPASQYVYPSVHVRTRPEFIDYARPSFTPGRALVEAACHLTARIHHEFSYRAGSTEIGTPAETTLIRRAGVCQDFAHVLLCCLRSLGLAARYVSGYLLTMPPPGQPRLRGADASHAWVSVYVPDLPAWLPVIGGAVPAGEDSTPQGGWFDLDPTNNRVGWMAPGEDYVCLAVGRDFADVSPIRGVLYGHADHTLSVGVTVEPIA